MWVETCLNLTTFTAEQAWCTTLLGLPNCCRQWMHHTGFGMDSNPQLFHTNTNCTEWYIYCAYQECIWRGSSFHPFCQSACMLLTRASPRLGGVHAVLIIWHSLKLIFFKLLWPRTGMAKLFEGPCLNYRQFSEKFFCMWEPEFTSTIFPIIPVMS